MHCAVSKHYSLSDEHTLAPSLIATAALACDMNSLEPDLKSTPWLTGAPKADWAAPPHSKRQATPSLTPARAAKQPHPMAAAAARRARMKELESTPPTHLLSQNAPDRALTPAKRALCSAAVNAELAPAKRLHMMHAPEGSAGLQWQQQRMMHEGEYDMEGGFNAAPAPLGNQLPFRTQPESRLNRLCPSPGGNAVYQQSVGNTAPYITGSVGIGRATSGLLMSVARSPTQHHPMRKEVGNLPSGSRGAVAGSQLRTPLRPDSAGSALRGYVPPEHRFVSYR